MIAVYQFKFRIDEGLSCDIHIIYTMSIIEQNYQAIVDAIDWGCTNGKQSTRKLTPISDHSQDGPNFF